MHLVLYKAQIIAFQTLIMAYRPLVVAMLSLSRYSSAFSPRGLATTGRAMSVTRERSSHVWQRWPTNGRLRMSPSSTITPRASGRALGSSMSDDRGERNLSAASRGRPYYVTTPIYYVNDKPHIGHAYTTLACDVIARFMRLDGREVMFLTGTDEHGQKVENSAEKAGKTPQGFCDEVSQQFRDLLTTMNFSNDKFIRTTDAYHKAAASSLWNVLRERGHIELGVYAGWYSVRDEAFYTEAELVDGKAPSGAEVEWLEKEPSYFFKLSEWQQPLLDFYEQNPDFIAPESRRNEAVSFVSRGLKDLSISRTSFSWGVPVPGDSDHVMYVWVDALTNYISALGYPDDKDGELDRFWPADLHVVGKDILRFHSVYWPALLLAAGLEPPKRLFVHGWWTKNGQKISKSTGNVIDPVGLVERYGVDPTRYFLMSEVPFGNDGDFSDEAFQNRVNSNLANEVGNLAMRTLSMAVKNCGGVPRLGDGDDVEGGLFTPEDEALLALAGACLGKVRPLVGETQQLHKALEAILQVTRGANKYLEDQAPWSLKKTDPQRMATVLWVVLETIRHVGILYQPFMPTSAARLLDQLGVPEGEARQFLALVPRGPFALETGKPLEKPVPIFPRIEAPEEAKAPATA